MSYDIVAFLSSCLLILTYYLYLGWRTRRCPDSSIHAHNAKIRARWVAMIMSSGNKMDILAIQTLRNSVIAANFMASTAILLIIGAVNISDKIGQWAVNWHPFAFNLPSTGVLWEIKLAFLLLNFSIAFFFFSMAIRYFNHVGYMINLPSDISNDTLYHQTCAYFNSAGKYYMFGTRSFFFSAPIIMWFFGPYCLVLATVGLTCGLALLDRTPNWKLSEKQ